MKREKQILEIYQKLSPVLYSTVYRILANREEAEECMQDAFVKLFSSSIEFASEASRFVWLRKVATREAIDRLRTRKHRAAWMDSFANDPLEAETEDYQIDSSICNLFVTTNNNNVTNMNSNLVDAVKEALMSLPDGYRSILSLALFEGFDFDEIAQILDIKPVSVRSQYSRGRQKLQDILKTKKVWTL